MVVNSVIEAARQLLRIDGEESVSVRSIAHRAGVGVGSVYDYFTTRDGIMDALIQRMNQENFNELLAVMHEREDEPAARVLEALVDRVFALYLSEPRLTSAAIRAIVSSGLAPALTAERDRFVVHIAARLGKEIALPNDELYARSLAVVDMLFGLILAEVFRHPDATRREALRASIVRCLQAELAAAQAAALEPASCSDGNEKPPGGEPHDGFRTV